MPAGILLCCHYVLLNQMVNQAINPYVAGNDQDQERGEDNQIGVWKKF